MEDFNPDDAPKESKREEEEEGDLVGLLFIFFKDSIFFSRIIVTYIFPLICYSYLPCKFDSRDV